MYELPLCYLYKILLPMILLKQIKNFVRNIANRWQDTRETIKSSNVTKTKKATDKRQTI